MKPAIIFFLLTFYTNRLRARLIAYQQEQAEAERQLSAVYDQQVNELYLSTMRNIINSSSEFGRAVAADIGGSHTEYRWEYDLNGNMRQRLYVDDIEHPDAIPEPFY